MGVKHLLWGGVGSQGHRKGKDTGEPQDAGELGVPEAEGGSGTEPTDVMILLL